MEEREKENRRIKFIKEFQPLPDRSNMKEIVICSRKIERNMNEIDNSVLFGLQNCSKSLSQKKKP